MIRDRIKSIDFWNDRIEQKKSNLLIMENKLNDVVPERINASRQFIELKRLELMIAMYSGGEDISECKKVYIKNLNNIGECHDYIESYVDLIWYISLGILFNIKSNEVEKLNKMILPKYKDDKLVCFFMKYLKGDYSEGKKYYMDNPYGFLDSLLNDGVNNLNSYIDEYLKKWYKAHNFEYWHDIHVRDENLYFGYWSFELGALIKIKGLNNESLKDINYYPYDLVEFKD